jgi:hypothetical protein
MDVPAELSQLALCLVAVPERAEGVECLRGELELERRTVAVACLSERASREFPRGIRAPFGRSGGRLGAAVPSFSESEGSPELVDG